MLISWHLMHTSAKKKSTKQQQILIDGAHLYASEKLECALTGLFNPLPVAKYNWKSGEFGYCCSILIVNKRVFPVMILTHLDLNIHVNENIRNAKKKKETETTLLGICTYIK